MARDRTIAQAEESEKRHPRARTGSGSPSRTAAGGEASDHFPRRCCWPAIALVIGAAALRLWTAGSLRADLRIAEPTLDGRFYLDLATHLAQGGNWPTGPIFLTPLYPFLLSGVFRLVGSGVGAVQLFQSLLGMATPGLLFLAARRDLGLPAAAGATVLYVLCGPVLAMESLVLTESLLLFLAAAALWTWPGRHRAIWAPPVFGVVCGLLALGRGTFLLLPGAWIAWMLRRRRWPERAGSLVRPTILVFGGVLVALMPLATHQTRATGHLQLLTLNGGLNLYLGNNPAARGLYSLPAGIDLEKDLTGARSLSVRTRRELTPVEADRTFAAMAGSFVRRQPGRAVWLVARKALLYLAPREIPQIENYEMLRKDTRPLRVAFVDFRWLLPLAVLGVAAARSRRMLRSGPPGGVHLAPWLMLVAIGWISTILFFATGRYRIPFLAGFLGLAGLGLSDLAKIAWRAFAARTNRSAEPGAVAGAGSDVGGAHAPRLPVRLALVPAVMAVQLLLPGYPVEAARAFDCTQLGMREARRGNPEAALRHYREALRIDPNSGEAWHSAGAALAKTGQLAEAAAAYRRAAQILPESPVTHYNLGAVYGRLGDDAAALAEFREAVRLDPFEPAYRSDLGVALARTGDRAAAVTEFRRALERDPNHAPARRGLEALGIQP